MQIGVYGFLTNCRAVDWRLRRRTSLHRWNTGGEATDFCGVWPFAEAPRPAAEAARMITAAFTPAAKGHLVRCPEDGILRPDAKE